MSHLQDMGLLLPAAASSPVKPAIRVSPMREDANPILSKLSATASAEPLKLRHHTQHNRIGILFRYLQVIPFAGRVLPVFHKSNRNPSRCRNH